MVFIRHCHLSNAICAPPPSPLPDPWCWINKGTDACRPLPTPPRRTRASLVNTTQRAQASGHVFLHTLSPNGWRQRVTEGEGARVQPLLLLLYLFLMDAIKA